MMNRTLMCNQERLNFFARLAKTLAVMLIIVGTVPAFSSTAEAAKLVERMRDWAVYVHAKGEEKLCFVISRPKSMEPRKVLRGDVIFYVSSWPGQGVKNEVSVKMGYPFKDGIQPTVKIDKKSFKLFVSKDKGYIEDPGKETTFVNAMKRGSNMAIYGTSKRGTETVDRYSLSGITAALKRLKSVCK